MSDPPETKSKKANVRYHSESHSEVRSWRPVKQTRKRQPDSREKRQHHSYGHARTLTLTPVSPAGALFSMTSVTSPVVVELGTLPPPTAWYSTWSPTWRLRAHHQYLETRR